jgi:mannitol 2-dehydrogenase
LVVKHPDGSLSPRVVGSIVDYLLAPDDPEAVLARLVDPATRVVSLTITEGGYNMSATGEFVPDLEIEQDLEPDVPPSTVVGYLTEALVRRRAAGTSPFVVMSCDNIAGNGEVTAAMVTGFARLRDPELATWIEQSVSFPSSMVDRITPVTTDVDRARLSDAFGVEDAWPVVCEPFAQWVLEERFPDGRPPWEDAGVQVVDDVEPYELMKLRLLNAGHQAIGYLGYLAGYRYAHEVCSDPLFVRFLRGYMDDEATPSLPEVPGIDLDAYKSNLVERFASPEIKDTLARLCAYSSDRIPPWLLPVVRHQLASGGEVRRSALIVAAWARYAEAVDESGEPIDVVDRRRDSVLAKAQQQGEEPLAFLQDGELFGDIAEDETFTSAYLAALESLHVNGARATLEHWEDTVRSSSGAGSR